MPKSHRELKREILELLAKEDLPSLLEKVLRYPPRQVVNPLIGALCRDDVTRFKAVAAIGKVVAHLADQDMESARVIIRRFMWMLNEESGGMAWGVPEAMAECLANHRRLAEEYTSILISYIWPEGNYLEYPPAQRGVVWGIGRLASFHPDLLIRYQAPLRLLHLLHSPDPVVRALCVWAYGKMGPAVVGNLRDSLVETLKTLTVEQPQEIILLDDMKIMKWRFDQRVLENILQLFLDER